MNCICWPKWDVLCAFGMSKTDVYIHTVCSATKCTEHRFEFRYFCLFALFFACSFSYAEINTFFLWFYFYFSEKKKIMCVYAVRQMCDGLQPSRFCCFVFCFFFRQTYTWIDRVRGAHRPNRLNVEKRTWARKSESRSVWWIMTFFYSWLVIFHAVKQYASVTNKGMSNWMWSKWIFNSKGACVFVCIIHLHSPLTLAHTRSRFPSLSVPFGDCVNIDMMCVYERPQKVLDDGVFCYECLYFYTLLRFHISLLITSFEMICLFLLQYTDRA